MRKILPFILCCITGFAAGAQGYKVSLHSNYRSGIAYFTYHMGNNLNIQDSAAVNSAGNAVFQGDKKLPRGIYAIVFPGKRLNVDFFVDKEQAISVNADTNHLENSVITGSPANVLYKAYQSYVSVKGKQLQDERLAYNASRTKADSALHEANYNRFNKELNDYRDNIIKTKQGSMMAVLLSAMKDSPIPKMQPVTHRDSLDNYNFYKDHYWDGITFLDDRVIRTPFFLPKLERYYREVMSQAPDSLVRDIDYRLLLARSSPEMFKFLLNWYTDEYYNPKYMGQDAVFVHLFEKYHGPGESSWLDKKQMEKITNRAYMQMSNLIGEGAADLEFTNTEGKPASLYNVDAAYTVLVFWDPSCGHCKEEIPRLDSAYQASWKNKGVKVYAVLTEKESSKGAWLSFIKDHHLEDWVNVYQSDAAAAENEQSQKASFRQLYDVTITPTIYLLDRDKHIIAKKLTLKQLDEFLEVKIKQDQTKNG